MNRQTEESENRPASYQQAPKPYQDKIHRPEANAPAETSDSQHGRRVTLLGRVGRYFEVKQTTRGTLLAVFSVATDKPYRDESGNWLKKTVWQKIVVWGAAAQAIGERLHKGAPVYVEGKLKTREWTDRENRLHTTTELVARDVRFVDASENAMAA
jgi:single-strand DNA-binding protein